MAQLTGQYAKMMIDVGGVNTQLGELREWSISAASNKVDGTVMGDAWEKHHIGTKNWESEATCVEVDRFWLDLMDSHVTIQYFDQEDDVNPSYEGEASIDWERSAPRDDLIESSLTFTGNGPLISPKNDAS